MSLMKLLVCASALILGGGFLSLHAQSAPATASPAARGAETTDVCALLSVTEIHDVQGVALRDTKRTEENRGAFRAHQCFYQTTHFSASVSLLVALPSDAHPNGPRDYWRERFHPPGGQALAAESKLGTSQGEQAPQKKEQPPRPLSGIGDEAFWVGNHIAGAVYVLKGDLFVRLSVGGAGAEQDKIEKSTELLRGVLGRLRAGHHLTRE